MTRLRLLLPLAAWLGLAPLWLAAQPQTNQIEFSNCLLDLPGTTRTAEARCGTFSVPENPAEPDGRQIDLKVALVPAVSKDPHPDPLFLFAGGPGQAATEAYVQVERLFSKLHIKRDIVLIDQRGTGGSHPLDCPMDEDLPLEFTVNFELVEQETRKCLSRLQQDADLRYYTSSIAMGDYDQVREAMGYEQINLLGISYGTRTAQEYMRQFPERVRSAILDSVVPMSLNLGEEHARMLDRAVDIVLTDCRESAECNEHFPDLEQRLASLVRDLRENPAEVRIANPQTGEPLSFTMNDDLLAVAIRFLSYSSQGQALLPLLITEAHESGSLERIASQSLLVTGNLNETLSRGMELSVICSEDYPFFTPGNNDSETILGSTMREVMDLQCGIWPAGSVASDFHQMPERDIPVLLLSGERDPVTPPDYAETASAAYPQSLHLVATGQGHMAISNTCIHGIAMEFIDQGNVQQLDTECVDEIRPFPFFINLLGPSP